MPSPPKNRCLGCKKLVYGKRCLACRGKHRTELKNAQPWMRRNDGFALDAASQTLTRAKGWSAPESWWAGAPRDGWGDTYSAQQARMGLAPTSTTQGTW